MVRRRLEGFQSQEDGAAFVEMAIVITLLLIVTLGFVDFGYALYQWNQASKAVQVGARLAVVSDPVASNMGTVVAGINAGIIPGEPSAAYSFVCDGGTSSCTNATYSAAAMTRIVAGGDGACGPRAPGDPRPLGMCDVYSAIQPQNVRVSYTYSGLGYAGRPNGPVPTVQVSLQNLTFDFFFLGGLLGFGQINLPPMTGTATGEDLSSTFTN
ncbi:pilus assembly protein [Rhizobiales bacterium]|uniref:TadE/TadG family type IV pilus assembly protein n=1 Tax=Hongsoonwoonella zoysiae TaxID=2821844 RepID=UPI001560C143|nr:TadE/TadG family type IV pilus assembly protein [Hongsoonwoonella zoysiae]NRG18521.1 pilus assembly protein [Hongsoonwoonella zoysiae]